MGEIIAVAAGDGGKATAGRPLLLPRGEEYSQSLGEEEIQIGCPVSSVGVFSVENGG